MGVCSLFVIPLLLIYCSFETSASRILFFNGLGEGSHFFTAASLAEELQAKGHSISFLIGSQFAFRAENPKLKNIFDFHFVHTNASLREFMQTASMEAFSGINAFSDIHFLTSLGKHLTDVCETVFNRTLLQQLRQANFDLIVFDPSWPCCTLLGEYLKLEKVALMPGCLSGPILRMLGVVTNPATVVEFSLGYPQKMTFLQRCHNLIVSHLSELIVPHFTERPYIHLCEEFAIKGYTESLRNTNLFIIASDPVLDHKVSLMHGYVAAAGLTIRAPNPLSNDLEEFLLSAGDEGVIIVSLGTYVTGVPEEFWEILQEAFSRLPQKIIFQWKSDRPPKNMPNNVKTMEWLPQLDLLAHNKTKLLVYHGGNNGVYEALYHAVPLIVMPFTADQPDVAQRVVERGIGLQISVTEMTSDLIVERITTVLKDSKYQETVSRLSAIFRDRPQNSREKAAFMIEHVLKYGSEHLRSTDRDLNFIQLNLIDIYSFFIICAVILYYVILLVIKLIVRMVCGEKLKHE